MKTNRFAVYMLLIMIFSLLIMAFAPMSAIELPQELVDLLGVAVMLGFTALTKWVADKLGFDLKDKAAEYASLASAAIVTALNHYLTFLPGSYESLVNGLFAFLIIFLGGNGLFGLVFRKKNR